MLHCYSASYMSVFVLFPQIKKVNPDDYKRTFEEIVRNIDKMENECIPSVTLSKREVNISHQFSFDYSVVSASLISPAQFL